MDEIARIVAEGDKVALEAYCLATGYWQVREAAIRQDVDLDELEEMLWAIR